MLLNLLIFFNFFFFVFVGVHEEVTNLGRALRGVNENNNEVIIFTGLYG